ncbi:MAG: Serine/threonine kinase [Myxococcaceae bacterium]|nr:Serine/threonine kinase [Myxococcaceae bacterium]
MVTDPFDIVGSTLADRYEVLEAVAEGGCSVVYRAMHRVWQRPVAIKALRTLALAADERALLLDSFVREGAILAELSEKSTAICQARDVGTFVTSAGEWVPYLVLEWLEGQNLEHTLDLERELSVRPRSLERAIELMTPVAHALAAAHRAGIAHRDVKPSNLFVVGTDGEAPALKLLDFGIATVVSDANKRGQLEWGGYTPAYAAPEQLDTKRFGPTGPRTDVFALALVMTELLSGKSAMIGDTVEQLASQAMNLVRRPTPRARGAVVSDEVEAVFVRALAVDPRQRHADAGELWAALREAIDEPALETSAELAQTIDAPDSWLLRAAGVPRPGLAFRVAGAGAAAAAISAGIAYEHDPRGFLATVDQAHRLVSAILSSSSDLDRTATAAPAEIAGSAFREAGAAFPSATLPAAPATRPSEPVAKCRDGMTLILGGKFFMGSDDDLPVEHPAHAVSLESYCIETLEVTVRDYHACSDHGECKRAGKTNAWHGLDTSQRRALDPLCNVREPDARADHPINCVDWEMASTYCHAHHARLPTEAEWEFAARGPDGRRYPWGDDPPTAGHVNTCGLECAAWGVVTGVDLRAMYKASDGFPTSAPVGSFPLGRSPASVDDMIGNVSEWVADRFVPYGNAAESYDPHELRVLRGAAWNTSSPDAARATFRRGDDPTKRSFEIGFRCAASL